MCRIRQAYVLKMNKDCCKTKVLSKYQGSMLEQWRQHQG